MSEHHPDHLTDDALSALVDGGDAPDAARHVASCPACAARLAALRAVAAEVAAPVPPPPDTWIDGAVAAALAAACDTPATVTTLARRRHRPPAAWLAPVAAVLLLVVGVVAVVGRDGPTDGEDDVALDAFAVEQDGVGGATGAADLGDLGDLDDPEGLRALLGPFLGAGSQALAAPGGAEEDAGPMAAHDGGPSPAPAPAAGPDREGRAAGTPVGQCLAAVRAGDAGLGALLVAATATWRGTPAVVYGFATGDDHLTRRVYVLDAAGCAVLEVLSFRD